MFDGGAQRSVRGHAWFLYAVKTTMKPEADLMYKSIGYSRVDHAVNGPVANSEDPTREVLVYVQRSIGKAAGARPQFLERMVELLANLATGKHGTHLVSMGLDMTWGSPGDFVASLFKLQAASVPLFVLGNDP
jgi:hypothetical protein